MFATKTCSSSALISVYFLGAPSGYRSFNLLHTVVHNTFKPGAIDELLHYRICFSSIIISIIGLFDRPQS